MHSLSVLSVPSVVSSEPKEIISMNASFFDLSDYGKVEVAGRDAGRFLHNLCTNEILKLPLSSGCEAFLTTGQAKIVAYVFVFHTTLPERGEAYFLDAGPG